MTDDTEETATRVDSLEVGVNALVSMGFGEGEARRALGSVMRRHDVRAPALPIESVLRDALAVLT